MDAILHALQNQFVSGGLVLMLTGSLIALCRRTPKQVWGWLQRRLTIVVDISNDDPLFAWLSLWLASHPYSRRARALTATSERDEYGRKNEPSSSNDSTLPQILLTPAPGNHLMLYKRRLLWLSRDRKEVVPGSGESASFLSLWKREVFTIRIVGRNQDTARALLEDARAVALSRRQKKTEIFISGYDYWQRVEEKDPRPLSTIFLPAGITEGVVDDVAEFLGSQEWYINRGIPYRRGYLLYGIPGSGKTSLICALAGHFKTNLYILNVSSSRMSDDGLFHLLAQVPMRSMVLLEDVDSAFAHRVKSQDVENKLTFSGLLNALDGAASKDGSLVFMTTNHLDRLDDALVRPGRADVHLEFGQATADQANRMFCAFFPEAGGADGFGDKIVARQLSMADVQQHLIRNRDSAVRALNVIDGTELTQAIEEPAAGRTRPFAEIRKELKRAG